MSSRHFSLASLLFFSTFACTHAPAREVAANSQTTTTPVPLRAPLNPDRPVVIFLIHGIVGTPASFGDMSLTLADRFNTPQAERIKVYSLSYDTKNPNKDPLDFVQLLHQQIVDIFADPNNHLDPSDPFFMIAHSQGPIVAFKYI